MVNSNSIQGDQVVAEISWSTLLFSPFTNEQISTLQNHVFIGCLFVVLLVIFWLLLLLALFLLLHEHDQTKPLQKHSRRSIQTNKNPRRLRRYLYSQNRKWNQSKD